MYQLILFGSNSILFSVAFILNLLLKNAGIVDVIWPLTFILDIIITDKLYAINSNYKLLFCLILFLSSFRLFIYLLLRFIKHHPKEDIRYTNFKQVYKNHPHISILFVYQLQALFGTILFSLISPVLLSSNNKIEMLNQLAFIISIIAILGELVADWQLYSFKNKNSNKICNIGLWKYSRHPNYFCEWLTWVALALYSYNAKNGYMAFISSIIMYFVLTKFTGIKPTEELMAIKYQQEFEQYKKTTSSFIPFI